MSYKHLSAVDRVVIDTLLSESRTQTYIASRIGVDKSTVGREVKRNASKRKLKHPKLIDRPAILDFDGRKLRGSGLIKEKHAAIATYNEAFLLQTKRNKYYYARAASKKTKARHRIANQKRLKLADGSNSFLEQYILDKLCQEQWSPEQIAGRLLKDYSMKISPQTIYDYIYNSGNKKKLVKCLRHGGNKYRRKHGTIARIKNQKNNLPSIHNRDPVIEARTRLNDYEGDTIVGLDKKDRLLTYVDRTSGECLIGLVLGFSPQKITTATRQLTVASKAKLDTITYDRGIEFTDYEAISRHSEASIYFADAYSSWQRGTNENLNGLIRQYYPKRSDFKQLTQKHVTVVQNKLNNRPRKRYNYRTPVEQRTYLISLQKVALRN